MAHETNSELEQVIAGEQDGIQKRRRRIRKRVKCQAREMEPSRGRPDDPEPADNLIGLALSGGGIRSAATNIGVLQGLAKTGILQFVDYLSTVSGGGYLGACLSSLLSNRCRAEKGREYQFEGDNDTALFTTAWDNFPFRDDYPEHGGSAIENKSAQTLEKCSEITGRQQISHIRNLASYLVPRAHHFSASVTRAAGSVVMTTLAPLLWFFLVITVLTSVYMLMVSWAAPNMVIPDTGDSVAVEDAVRSRSSVVGGGHIVVIQGQGDKEETGVIDRGMHAVKIIGRNIYVPFKGIFSAEYWGPWVFSPLFWMLMVFWANTAFSSYLKPSTADGSGRGKNIFFILHMAGIFLATVGLFVCIRPKPVLVWNIAVLLFIWAGIFLVVFRMSRKLGNGTEAEQYRRSLLYRSTLISALLVASYAFMDFGLFFSGKNGVCPERAFVAPILVMTGALLVWYGRICFAARFCKRRTDWQVVRRSDMHLIAGALLWVLLATIVLAVLPGFFRAGNSLILALIQAILLLGLRYYLKRPAGQGEKKKLPSKYKDFLLGFVSFVFIFMAVVLVGSIISGQMSESAAAEISCLQPGLGAQTTGVVEPVLIFLFGSLGGLIFFMLLVDVNRISPHYFYRDRLAEAFLQTRVKNNDTLPVMKRNDAEMLLTDLHGSIIHDAGIDGGDAGDGDAGSPVRGEKYAARGPYLLVNATLNLTAARDLKAFNRQADIFTFSRFHVGSEPTGYMSTPDYLKDEGGIKLARAMTISGAAVSSVMGQNSSVLTSFICTILGLRLGYWLPNPKYPGKKSAFRYEWKRLPYELFNHTHVRGEEIYLSDGGHSGDNLGFIPLLKRRAKLIIVSDSECDPKHAFDSLNNSIRKAYVDDGIKIDISLKDLEPDENGYSTSHFAVGRVLYPDRPWQRSWIMVLKNTVTEDEITPIQNYRKKSPDFPHETTGDQFFTEEQFESYRALGRHAADDAFAPVLKWLDRCRRPSNFTKDRKARDIWLNLEELCTKIEGSLFRKKTPWDDVLTAMWAAEQGGFEGWPEFSDMIGRFREKYQKVQATKKHYAGEAEPETAMEKDLKRVCGLIDVLESERKKDEKSVYLLPPRSMADFENILKSYGLG